MKMCVVRSVEGEGGGGGRRGAGEGRGRGRAIVQPWRPSNLDKSRATASLASSHLFKHCT